MSEISKLDNLDTLETQRNKINQTVEAVNNTGGGVPAGAVLHVDLEYRAQSDRFNTVPVQKGWDGWGPGYPNPAYPTPTAPAHYYYCVSALSQWKPIEISDVYNEWDSNQFIAASDGFYTFNTTSPTIKGIVTASFFYTAVLIKRNGDNDNQWKSYKWNHEGGSRGNGSTNVAKDAQSEPITIELFTGDAVIIGTCLNAITTLDPHWGAGVYGHANTPQPYGDFNTDVGHLEIYRSDAV